MVDVLIPRELDPGEQRVAATPETVKRLLARGLSLHVEEGAGWAAGFADSDYRSAGATLVGDGAEGRLRVGLTEVTPAELNRNLVQAGLDVGAVVPITGTLEDVYLATTRQEASLI